MKKLVTHLKKGGFKPLDLYQRKTPEDNLPVAQKWCSQFDKKAKFLKSGWQRHYYSCN